MARSNTLVTKTAFAKVPPIGGTKGQGDNARAFVKLFSNFSDHRHYVLEYNPETGEAFVLTTNQDVCEYGYISIPEMQELNTNHRQHRFPCPPMQREIHGTPVNGYRMGDIKAAHATQWS